MEWCLGNCLESAADFRQRPQQTTDALVVRDRVEKPTSEALVGPVYIRVERIEIAELRSFKKAASRLTAVSIK